MEAISNEENSAAVPPPDLDPIIQDSRPGSTSPAITDDSTNPDGTIQTTTQNPRSHSIRASRKSRKTSLNRKGSDKKKKKCLPPHEQEIIPGFEELAQQTVLKMGLYWLNFRIYGSGIELYESGQSHYCSLTVTGRNEIFIRKRNAEFLLRIHSNIVEDTRYFHFYTSEEKYLGFVSCDVKQGFKLNSKLQNAITKQIFNVSVQSRDSNQKSWSIIEERTENGVGFIHAQIGHRWKSFYTLSYTESKTSLSNQVLLLGLLLSLASARLESELLPAILAVSAFFLTFIIFFIIQFA